MKNIQTKIAMRLMALLITIGTLLGVFVPATVFAQVQTGSLVLTFSDTGPIDIPVGGIVSVPFQLVIKDINGDPQTEGTTLFYGVGTVPEATPTSGPPAPSSGPGIVNGNINFSDRLYETFGAGVHSFAIHASHTKFVPPGAFLSSNEVTIQIRLVERVILEASPSEWNLPDEEAGTTSIAVTSNISWTATSDASWVTVTSGARAFAWSPGSERRIL